VKSEDFVLRRKEWTESRFKLSDEKSKEYTIGHEEDRQYNFHKVGELLDLPPETVLMVYFLKHVFGICDFVKRGGNPHATESILGRIDDAQNYLDNLRPLVEELQQRTLPKP
jgi:hypothetical protein